MKKHTSLVKREDKEIKLMRKLEMKSMIDSQVERHHQSLREWSMAEESQKQRERQMMREFERSFKLEQHQAKTLKNQVINDLRASNLRKWREESSQLLFESQLSKLEERKASEAAVKPFEFNQLSHFQKVRTLASKTEQFVQYTKEKSPIKNYSIAIKERERSLEA